MFAKGHTLFIFGIVAGPAAQETAVLYLVI
jgi:hypothetical protein